MILPGIPRISQQNWDQGQHMDLLNIWQDIARVVNTNAVVGALSDFPTAGVNFTYTIAANTLVNVSDQIQATYTGTGQSVQLNLNSTSLLTGTGTGAWILQTTITRTGSNSAQASSVLLINNALPIVSNVALTNLNFGMPLTLQLLAPGATTGSVKYFRASGIT